MESVVRTDISNRGENASIKTGGKEVIYYLPLLNMINFERYVLMIGMDFLEFYQENPTTAITVLIIAVSIVILGFAITAYSKHKEAKRKIREQALNEQFKRKCNIK